MNMFVLPTPNVNIHLQTVDSDAMVSYDEYIAYAEACDNAPVQKRKGTYKNPAKPGNNQKQGKRDLYFRDRVKKMNRKASKPSHHLENDRTRGDPSP